MPCAWFAYLIKGVWHIMGHLNLNELPSAFNYFNSPFGNLFTHPLQTFDKNAYSLLTN